MDKKTILAISGVIVVSFLLISNTTLVQNVQGRYLKETINDTENNRLLFSMMSNFLSKFENYDENNLKKQVTKIMTYVNQSKFKNKLSTIQSFFKKTFDENFLNKIDTNKYLKISANQFFNNCSNQKNLVTLRVCKISGVEEITRELSNDEVIRLTTSLDKMKKSLRIIHSEKSNPNEKEEAHKVINNSYYYLKDLDLLPADMKKKEAIDLINGAYGKKIFEKLRWLKIPGPVSNQKKNKLLDNDIHNNWCSVSCNGSAHIEYIFIDMLLLLLGSLPRFIIASPILIPAITILPVIAPSLLLIYMIVVILDEMGYHVDEIMIIVETFINIIISVLYIFLWVFEPGFKLMYLHHKIIPERKIIGYAKISDGNVSVETQGLNGYQCGNVSDLEITGFIGLWIESNIQTPEFPDLLFKSTLSCNGYALGVSTPP